MPPARPDGRPLYFDIPPSAAGIPCYFCESHLNMGGVYHRGHVYMNDPANSPVKGPDGMPDESIYFICKHHTPENAVIYDPASGDCHNKSGTEVWREDTDMPDRAN